jgi:ATP-dependent exoDNAse (exonuclease V) beta subunit
MEEHIDEPGGQAWGSLVHRLLEYFYLRTPQEDPTKIKQLLTQFPPDTRQLNHYQTKLQKMIDDFRQSHLAKKIDPLLAKSEFIVSMRMDPYILHGIFDLLYQTASGRWEVVDFKSNRIRASEVNSLTKKYEFQIQAYALLLAGLYPDQKTYSVSLYFLEPSKIIKREYNLLEIESIRSEITFSLDKLARYERTIFAP